MYRNVIFQLDLITFVIKIQHYVLENRKRRDTNFQYIIKNSVYANGLV